MNKLIVEFEKHEVVKDFMDIFDVYHTNLGGYRYSKDGSPCYQLNGMLIMFEEQQKKIDLLVKEITETQAFLNNQSHIKQVKINKLQARINVYELHINALKNIHECDFNEQSESSYLLGNLGGFFECVESDLKEIQNDGGNFNFKGKPNEL